MKPTQNLPANFALAWSLDLQHNTRLNIILQLIGLGWMGLAGGLLTLCLLWMRPEFNILPLLSGGLNLLTGLVILVVVMAVTILIHELVHGLFFWLFTRRRPEFGLGPGYAFAAMPDWFYPKKQYLVIGLSPLVLLTVAGLAASALVPQAWLAALLAGMVINAGGAIGDMYVCWRIARDAPDVWIKDTGDGFQLYRAARLAG
jgi:Putative zincin peptidase